MSSSPSRGNRLYEEDSESFIRALGPQKDNVKQCLEVYRTYYDNMMPQKCLQHNNFITLYCQDEEKLLCVNCIYGSSQHKSHRVVPSKTSLDLIASDNDVHLRGLESEVERMRVAEVELAKNSRALGEDSKKVLAELEAQFKEMSFCLEEKQRLMRERVVETFAKAKERTEVGRAEVAEWKNELTKVNSQLPRLNSTSVPEDREAEAYYKHLVLETVGKEKLDTDQLMFMASPLETASQVLNEVSDLKQTIKSKTKVGGPAKVASNKSERIKIF